MCVVGSSSLVIKQRYTPTNERLLFGAVATVKIMIQMHSNAFSTGIEITTSEIDSPEEAGMTDMI